MISAKVIVNLVECEEQCYRDNSDYSKTYPNKNTRSQFHVDFRNENEQKKAVCVFFYVNVD